MAHLGSRPAGVLILASLVAATVALAAPVRADRPQERDVIAQMFGWNWRSIARECQETLGPLGYGAVQTSPPQEHPVVPELGFPWWQSYSAVSYSLDSRWGTRDEYASMVRSCHDAGVQVYADAVVNNMSGKEGCGTGSAGTRYCHFSYPTVPYDIDDFHHCGPPDDANLDYGNRFQVHNCQFFGMADLATEDDAVRDKIANYLDDLLSLGVDGFRIDSAKYVPPEDLSAIQRRLDRPAYVYQEVPGGPGAVQPDEYLNTGDVMDLHYAASLSSIFRHGKLAQLGDFGSALPSGRSVVFAANHDTERTGATLTAADGDSYVLANAFMLAWPYGRPKVLSGYAFAAYDQPPPSDPRGHALDAVCGVGQWRCEHSRPGIAGMIGFRGQVGDSPVVRWSDNGANLISFGRGSSGHVILNGEATRAPGGVYRTSLPPGRYCDVMHGLLRSGSCTGPTYEIDSAGELHADIAPHSGIALHTGATV